MRSRTSIYSHRRKNRKKSLLIFLAVLLLAAALALGVSAYWGKMQEKNEQQTAQAQAQGEIPKEVLSQEQLEESSPTEDSIQSNPTPSQEQPEKQENPVAEEKQPEPSQPDVTELTSERILSSAALVPNSGSSV